MKVQEAIESRVSIREFSNKTVKFGLVLEAIDAANHAPFAGNINNLQYLIIETQENKNLVAEYAQQYWINEAQWVVIVCSEFKKLGELYQDRALMYAKQQAGAAIENMLLRITELGLASCWVGAFASEGLKAHFKIPDNWEIEAIIPIAYPKHKNNKHQRKTKLESKIFWEKWKVDKKPESYPKKDPSTYDTIGHIEYKK
ncbi:MAG: nitroreductase family protein [Candidatus Pacearchaeota archaeon]